jgi:DnaJ-class molecular chaperone
MALPAPVSNLIDLRTKRGKVEVDAVRQITRIAYSMGLGSRNKTVKRPKRQSNTATTCPKCKGGGYISIRQKNGSGMHQCSHCRGTGRIKAVKQKATKDPGKARWWDHNGLGNSAGL